MRAAAGDTQIEWQAATHSEVGSMYDTDHSEGFFPPLVLNKKKMSPTPVKENVPVIFKTSRRASQSTSPVAPGCRHPNTACMHEGHSSHRLHAVNCIHTLPPTAPTCLMPPPLPTPHHHRCPPTPPNKDGDLSPLRNVHRHIGRVASASVSGRDHLAS